MKLGAILSRTGAVPMNTSDGTAVLLGGGLQGPILGLLGIPHLGARLRHRAFERALGNLTFSCAVELGCGAGLLGASLSPRVSQMVGLDLDRTRLTTAARLIPHLATPFLAIRADACRAPLRTAACDLVICSEVIEHISDDEGCLKEARRLLALGGLLLLSTTANQPWNHEAEDEFDHARPGYGGSELEALVLRSGFTVLSCSPYGRSSVTRACWKLHRLMTRISPVLGGLSFLPVYGLSLLAEGICERFGRTAPGEPDPPALGWIVTASDS